jgi:hypothetical protein
MKPNPVEKNKKKAYEKPSLRVVSITDSVQVLGIGCKTERAVPNPHANVFIPCMARKCFQKGS